MTIPQAAIDAAAHALIGAANDFGEGDQIAGDTRTLAAAALEAAAPHIAAAERERIRQLIHAQAEKPEWYSERFAAWAIADLLTEPEGA